MAKTTGTPVTAYGPNNVVLPNGGNNWAGAYDRPQENIMATTANQFGTGNESVEYTDWGIVPNVAQNAQNATYAPQLKQGTAFTASQYNMAQWFTTRVHLSPLGKASS